MGRFDFRSGRDQSNPLRLLTPKSEFQVLRSIHVTQYSRIIHLQQLQIARVISQYLPGTRISAQKHQLVSVKLAETDRMTPLAPIDRCSNRSAGFFY